MKIHYDMLKETKEQDRIVQDILKGKRSLADVFDKAAFIEKIWEKAPVGKALTVKLDDEKKNYPEILLNFKPPRIIIQDNGKTIPFEEYLKRFANDDYNMSVSFKNEEYFLTIKKTRDIKLDLKLKLDRDKTIDISKMFKDIKGIRTYYHVKKNEL